MRQRSEENVTVTCLTVLINPAIQSLNTSTINSMKVQFMKFNHEKSETTRKRKYTNMNFTKYIKFTKSSKQSNSQLQILHCKGLW